MSFQAYLDTIREKTGLGPDDFRRIAAERGLTQHADILAWAKGELGLGHGHANAIAAVLKQAATGGPSSDDDKLAAHFSGNKAAWRTAFDALAADVTAFGGDVEFAPAQSYINLNRGKKKFGIVQIGVERMDVGIKLKGYDPGERLEAAGSWNTMVTHRVRVTAGAQVDKELLGWLRAAYDAA
ncbi:hypothetical protein ABI_37430 [Asticcacaulis biprosthecium C19]|uniref:DUF5655 domain-containing protein n=1 Tax=Asticcacaulis biprosthecium C19 TaxID=715226 RepID=F4QR74_9CAUL|nr:DUF4287 domain-containing protein [Asticcacaulis biprosthecium]EGF90711.1 hypothetical protein ABI_37430 [Asticcacaulis biprosthecium C19]